MAGMFDKIRGTDEDEVKRRADEFAAKQGAGQLAEEEGLEEGDISDYIMPIKGLGRNLLKAVAEKSVSAGAKEAGKAAVKEGAQVAKQGILKYTKQKIQQKPEVAGPDYKNENIAFRPTKKPKQEGWERFNFGKTPAN